MKRLNMKSKDLIDHNIEKIGSMFPNVVIESQDEEGNIIKTIDFELLQQEITREAIPGIKERYQLTWPGRKEALVMANTPTDNTLRPIKEESSNWETTQNIFIEGDNLEVLKLLQESYLNRIKCIYIDPPYNTGKDFIYKDNFAGEKDEYLQESGQVDEEGNRLFQNNEYNGRYHSDWLTMVYSRLKLARNLLREDGCVFISIDDNELHNLRKICDEIFGERNFVANLVWTNKEGGGSSDTKYYKVKHEYILCYAKNIESLVVHGVEQKEDSSYAYSDEHVKERGKHKLIKLNSFSIQYSESLDYPITIDGETFYPSENGKRGCWRWSKEKFKWGLKNDFIVIKKGQDGKNKVYTKQYFKVDNENKPITRSLPPNALIDKYSSTMATKQLEKLLGSKIFDYSKPYLLICDLIKSVTDEDSIILDFFSGSATTAHAVMELNAEDEGNRKYIMVQLPELTDEKSVAYKSGFKTIADIGKERIRKAGQKIKEETKANIDYGFRAFKLDSSNMKEVYYRPDELEQNLIEKLESNIKEDRNSMDLLIQVMLELGLELSLNIETKVINDKEVYYVEENSLIACFDKDLNESLIKEIAKIKPLKAVFRDNSFASCSDRINLEEIFKNISPNTEIKII